MRTDVSQHTAIAVAATALAEPIADVPAAHACGSEQQHDGVGRVRIELRQSKMKDLATCCLTGFLKLIEIV